MQTKPTALFAGDPITEMFILKSGIVKVLNINAKGEEKVLQIIKAPAILPLDCLRAIPETVSWHYGALTDVELVQRVAESGRYRSST